MRPYTIAAVAAMTLFAAGCRRADFREYTFEIPGMTDENKSVIQKAVTFYDGVNPDSLVFDLEKKTLTLRFDSMKVAQTNIRMAIEEKGIAVKYPEKKEAEAGYINARAKEVKAD